MLVGHSVEEPLDVLFGANDAGQSQHLNRWVVGVYTHVHAIFFASGHDSLEEVFHVGTKLCLVNTFVEIQEVAELLDRSLVVLAEVARHEALCLNDDGLHQFVVFLGSHCLGEFVAFCQNVATSTHTCGELELCPLLASAFTLQDVNIEVSKFGIVEIEVGGTVGVLMQQVGACPVEHRHEVVADAVDAFSREVTQALLIHLNLMVTVRTAILDSLHHRQTLHHAPAHAITLNICFQIVDLLTCPHLTKRYVVQSSHDALHANLFQLGKGDFVLLAKPTPCSFHIVSVNDIVGAKLDKKRHLCLFLRIIFVLRCVK